MSLAWMLYRELGLWLWLCWQVGIQQCFPQDLRGGWKDLKKWQRPQMASRVTWQCVNCHWTLLDREAYENMGQSKIKVSHPLFPLLLSISLFSLSLYCCKFFVSLMTKHLLQYRSVSLKNIVLQEKWQVCRSIKSDSSENGCNSFFPRSVYESCQAMLWLSNYSAGGHIIELILSINIDNNKED